MARSVDDFAFDLAHKLGSDHDNLVFSPLGVSAALGLTYAGASGATRSEMQRVLHLAPEDARVYEGYRSLMSELDGRAPAGGAHWTLVNSLWAQEGMPLQPAFLQAARNSFGSEVSALDFRGAPEAARGTINGWVAQATANKIRELLATGAIDPSTRLVLANAVYFKARWATAFDTRGTRPAPFHLLGGAQKTVPMMQLIHRFGLTRISGARVIELPYLGGKLSMMILLPDDVFGLKRLERRLDADSLQAWASALREQEVVVDLPRFVTTGQYELSPVLAGLGMPSAFDVQTADFTGMTGTSKLSISLVVHKAYVEVNEEGTEAAAATGVVATIATVPIPEMFIVDRPFLFFIRDRDSGCILFQGRISDPTL